MILELLETTGRLQELGAIVYALYSIYKELRWTPLTMSATPTELALLTATIVIALACGILAGRAARFRPLSNHNRAALQRRHERRRRSRSGQVPRGA